MTNAALNYKDQFNAVQRPPYKFVNVKAKFISAPLIFYIGYLVAFGRHKGKPLEPLCLRLIKTFFKTKNRLTRTNQSSLRKIWVFENTVHP